MKNIAPRKVLAALIRADGIIRDAAKMLHTTTRNVARIIDEHPEIQAEIQECHTDLLDEALLSAKELVQQRDGNMTKFVLTMLGDKRGIKKPIRQVEVSGNAEKPLVTKNTIDLSGLSDEELAIMEKVLKKEKKEDATDIPATT